MDNKDVTRRMAQLAADGDWDEWALLHHDDCVFEWPQSGERIEGVQNLIEIMRDMPGGGPTATLVKVRGEGDLIVSESRAVYPDGSIWWWSNIIEFKGGKAAHETDYFAQAFDPPDSRAKWVTKM